jgi:hypothetical protein
MATALPLILFLGFLFGATLLILVCGIQSRDEERAATGEDLATIELAAVPRYFARPGRAAPEAPVAVVVDESALRSLELFLREEMALAEVFVDDPTLEHLHERSPREREHRETVFRHLEGFLRGEDASVSEYVARPSVERLYAGGLAG